MFKESIRINLTKLYTVFYSSKFGFFERSLGNIHTIVGTFTRVTYLILKATVKKSQRFTEFSAENRFHHNETFRKSSFVGYFFGVHVVAQAFSVRYKNIQ